MEHDTLGDRMKDFYENRSKTYLTRRMPVVIRIDGCHFHSFTRGLRRPYDKVFIKTMQRTTQALCENIQGCKIGYVESDEISLLLTDYDNLTTAAWFDNSVQKVCSVAASMTAMYFNRFFEEEVESWAIDAHKNGDLSEEDLAYYKKLCDKVSLGGYFDARAFNLPESEVVNYFIWRQNDASRNSIQGLAHANFSQSSIQSLNNSQIQDKLFNEKGVNWNDCSTVEKRGTCVIKEPVIENVQDDPKSTDTLRLKWVVDEDIPIFTQDRTYIERVLPVKENNG